MKQTFKLLIIIFSLLIGTATIARADSLAFIHCYNDQGEAGKTEPSKKCNMPDGTVESFDINAHAPAIMSHLIASSGAPCPGVFKTYPSGNITVNVLFLDHPVEEATLRCVR